MKKPRPIDVEAILEYLMSKPDPSAGVGAIVGDHGDMIFQGPSGLGALPADLGSGFMVMVSRGVGFDPVLIDLLALISFITGGLNMQFTFVMSVAIPSVSITTAVDSGAGDSQTVSMSTVIPSIAIAAAANSGVGGSETVPTSVPIPSVSITTQVIP